MAGTLLVYAGGRSSCCWEEDALVLLDVDALELALEGTDFLSISLMVLRICDNYKGESKSA